MRKRFCLGIEIYIHDYMVLVQIIDTMLDMFCCAVC